ncbi:MAG: hypothetical protein JWM33_1651 [Caulobacteraceae bacterium]|nr:hypothetical protein [Caulobacteraceae bacterium]
MTELIEHHSEGGDRGARAALGDLRGLLIEGESLAAFALEHRLYALVHRRHLAAATSGRLIFMKRRLLGGFDPVIIRWQDLKEVSITVGMFTATVVVAYSANMSDTAMEGSQFETLRLTSLRKEPAGALYRECQAQEQSWREKRRVRSMEEMRAKSGAVQVATGLYPPGDPGPRVIEHGDAGSTADNPTQRLLRAKEMLAQGLISDSEFEAIKAKIVGGL